MPQKWTTNWPLDVDTPENATKRDTAIHRLGNPTLLTSKLNGSLQNNPWSLKRPDIQSHSLMRFTTASVLTRATPERPWSGGNWEETWREEHIKYRSGVLAEIALGRWTRPEAQAGHAGGAGPASAQQ